MAKIVIAPFGSLGDLHPMIALALELRQRGHTVVFSTMDFYREKLETLGFEVRPMRPHFDIEDRDLVVKLLDPQKGPENMIKHTIFPVLHETYEDLMRNVADADLFISGEVVYAAKSVSEKSGVKWVSTSLSPISLFSNFDPGVFPQAEWLDNLRFMPVLFHQTLFAFLRWTLNLSGMFDQYKKFRRDIGLREDHDPVFREKASDLLHLVMFSKVLMVPQPDWFPAAVQTGFCFYDGQQDHGKMPDGLQEFLHASEAAGEPPIIFTLGSAAVMDPGKFFEESIAAAKKLNKRAVLLYGVYNEPPAGLTDDIAGFPYAPYSQVFPRAAAVVHQGGIGTTSQVLRAGVPMIVMPYAHDQPDNAARCRRLGVSRTIGRYEYNADVAVRELTPLLNDPSYGAKAVEVASIIETETGTLTACDAIEAALRK